MAAHADGDGFNAPEAYTEGSRWGDPRGSAGVHKERGMRGEKRQKLGRPERFLTQGTGGNTGAQGIRIMSHGRGNPDTDVGRSLNGVESAAGRSSR